MSAADGRGTSASNSRGALTARLTSVLGLGRDDVVLYFTQHHPDEIFREGRFTDAWRAS
jgi:hypothetical protein